MDLSILSSLLPMAGAGAQGYMQGEQQGTALKQMRQIMAMREAEEMRSSLRFPKEMRGLDTANRTAEQNYSQSRDAFPLQQEGRQLDLANQRHLQGVSDSPLNAMIEEQFGYRIPEGAMHQDVMAMLPGMNSERSQEAITARARMPKSGTDPMKRFDRLLGMYRSALKEGSDMQVMLSSDPENQEMLKAYERAGKDRVMFKAWLITELKKEQPGWTPEVQANKSAREDEIAEAMAEEWAKDSSGGGIMSLFK